MKYWKSKEEKSVNRDNRKGGEGKKYSKDNRKGGEGKKYNKDSRKAGEGKEYTRDSRKAGEKTTGKQKYNGKKVPHGACTHMYECGGCRYQGTPYAEQLTLKQKQMENLLAPFGKVDPILKMEHPAYYRNKVAAAFTRLRNGVYISGTYEEGTHNVVAIESCMIENQKADEIIGTIRGMLKSFKIRTYDEDTGYGLLRHVLVRVGKKTGQIMVVLVLRSPILPSKKNFVKALREKHPEIATVVINVNDRDTSMILGDREIVIYGKGFILDELCDYTFKISPKSFYQVNPVQTEIMYRKAIEMADFKGSERIVDAYAGIGTIGIIASKHVKEVLSVELNRDAVADARWNAKYNAVDNISFYQADAGKFLMQMADQGEKVDVVIMDPPRNGSDEAFLSSIVKIGPEKVIYISCGPETLARDLKYLTGKGYKMKQACPVDLFPWTGHVETVTCLQRVNS